MNKKTVVGIITILTFGGLLYEITNDYPLLRYFLHSQLISNKVSSENPFESDTNQINKTMALKPGKVTEEIENNFENDPVGLETFKYGWGVKKVTDLNYWDYTETPFMASVELFDLENDKFQIKFLEPKSMPYLGETREYNISSCTLHEFYLTDAYLNTQYGDNSLINTVYEDSIFVSYCTEDRCNNIHRLCKFILPPNTINKDTPTL